MKIDTLPLEDHQVKLTVEVEPKPFEEAKQRAARKLARQVKIPGFRPGKAPYPVIVRHIGEPAIVEEAVEILVNEIYPEAIKEAKIEAYGPGSLEQIVSIDPPTFEFIVPLRAEVTLGDYHAIRQPYELEEILPEMVDEVLQNLRERQAIIEPVDRPALESDLVRIQLRADRKELEEGKSATLINSRQFSAVIQAEEPEDPSEWPFPGFSRRLIGMAAGDEASFYYAYPDDSEYESLRGSEAEFFISVEQVSSRQMPELDEELAKSVGDYATIDELREAIKQDLEKQEQADYNQEYDEKILEEIISISTIKYPPQMLEQEIETVLKRLENNLAQQNLDIDLYLKTRGMDMDALKEELKPVAEARLNRTLTLLEVAESEKIEVEPDELQNETNRTLNDLSNVMEEKDFRSLIRTDENRTNIVSSIMMDMIISRTQGRLREIAQGIVTATEGDQAESEASIEQIPDASAETNPGGEVIESDSSSMEAALNIQDSDSSAEDTVSEKTAAEASSSTQDTSS